ncbi:hypothetical protein IPG41_03410 [Candidatus Peregrinibacteria bacterium]|nr:MAG: hypothetical protein IPG41_03410 [Candidatus Peregrinibacteria bacterium]
MNIIEEINKLTVIGRTCVSVICFERFCNKFNISHPDIKNFIQHIWKVTQVNSNTWVEWESGFYHLTITGQGDPYNEDLINSIPKNLLEDFDKFSQYVFETTASTWYTSDITGSSEFLRKVLELCIKYDVPLPKLDFYTNPPNNIHNGWGKSLSDEEVKNWQSTI